MKKWLFFLLTGFCGAPSFAVESDGVKQQLMKIISEHDITFYGETHGNTDVLKLIIEVLDETAKSGDVKAFGTEFVLGQLENEFQAFLDNKNPTENEDYKFFNAIKSTKRGWSTRAPFRDYLRELRRIHQVYGLKICGIDSLGTKNREFEMADLAKGCLNSSNAKIIFHVGAAHAYSPVRVQQTLIDANPVIMSSRNDLSPEFKRMSILLHEMLPQKSIFTLFNMARDISSREEYAKQINAASGIFRTQLEGYKIFMDLLEPRWVTYNSSEIGLLLRMINPDLQSFSPYSFHDAYILWPDSKLLDFRNDDPRLGTVYAR